MLTLFIGREPELASLSELLCDPHCRLLTVTGPGGIGKTRLAIEVTSRHKDLFPDGIWFVPLAPLSSSDYLIPAIADALNFKCHGLTNPRSHLINYLQDKQTLLILDNAEHMLDCDELFAEILQNSRQVKLLVTSRERLNLLSEWVFEIQGLPVPPSDQAEHIKEFSSIALFLESARRIRAGFELRDKDRPWVVRICHIMEGMPLGIELAAAWVGILSCEEIAREIERNLDFLTVSMRDLPERHRSLRATLDHSWRLLDSEEKAILRRLSVFQGSFSRDAAEEICGASLALLSSLKDKSLLRRMDRGRYDLHELIHQYAALRLAEDPGQEEQAKNSHALYYARRLSEWERALKSSKQIDALSEIANEIDNLRQAWQWLVAHCELDSHKDTLRSPSLFHSSLFSLSLFYEMRCRNREAISLFGQSVESLKYASAVFDSPEDRWFFQTILGHITAHLGYHHAYVVQYPQAVAFLEEALGLLENSLASVEKAQAQIMLAWIFQTRGLVQKSVALLEQNLILLQEENDMWWYAQTLAYLGWAYLSIGKIQEGIARYQEGLRLVEPGDLRLRVPMQNGIAYASCLQGDYAGAERLLLDNQVLCFELGNKRQTALNYLELGQVMLATSRVELAEQNFQKCVDLLVEFGESHDLALGLIYSGKCSTVCLDIQSARRKFLQAIQIGQSLDIFYLVYWGLVNLARLFLLEGQPEKALELALVLQHDSVEVKIAQADGIRLMADLQEEVSPGQVDAAAVRAEGRSIESLLDRI